MEHAVVSTVWIYVASGVGALLLLNVVLVLVLATLARSSDRDDARE